jgi:hypothetical protein
MYLKTEIVKMRLTHVVLQEVRGLKKGYELVPEVLQVEGGLLDDEDKEVLGDDHGVEQQQGLDEAHLAEDENAISESFDPG